MAYGGGYAKDKAIEFGFDALTESILPGYKLMSSGVKVIGNTFDATEIFNAGYELQALGSAADFARDEYLGYISRFLKDPVRNYIECERRRNAFIDLFRLELIKYNELLTIMDNSEAVSAVRWIFERFGTEFVHPSDVDNMVYRFCHKYYDQYWNAYFGAYIKPFL